MAYKIFFKKETTDVFQLFQHNTEQAYHTL